MHVRKVVRNGVSTASVFQIGMKITCTFVLDKCLNSTKVYREIAVNGKHAISKWCCKFQNSRTDIIGYYRPERLTVFIIAKTVAVIEQVVKVNRRIQIKKISRRLDILYGSAHSIIHEYLQYRKLFAR